MCKWTEEGHQTRTHTHIIAIGFLQSRIPGNDGCDGKEKEGREGESDTEKTLWTSAKARRCRAETRITRKVPPPHNKNVEEKHKTSGPKRLNVLLLSTELREKWDHTQQKTKKHCDCSATAPCPFQFQSECSSTSEVDGDNCHSPFSIFILSSLYIDENVRIKIRT